MKALITSIMLLICMTEYAFAMEEETLMQEQTLQKEIAVYQQRALQDKRAAEESIFKDYPLYRNHTRNQAVNERMIEQLQETLMIVKQRIGKK